MDLIRERQQELLDLLKPTTFDTISKKFLAALFKDKEKESAFRKKCDGKRSFEEIFASFWELEEAHDMLDVTLGPYEKEESLANLIREEGNGYFKSGNYCKALERYNVSILLSPHPEIPEVEVLPDRNPVSDFYSYTHVKLSKYLEQNERVDNHVCLAKGYANRSAVMLELRCYDKCLRDIDLALKCGYPEDLQPKLLARRRKCLEALKETDMESLTREVCSRKALSFGGGLYTYSQDDLQQILYIPRTKCPVLEDPHPTIPALSSAVKLSYTPTKGRGLIADRNIRPGEILAVEEAYCVNLKQERVSSYCNYCVRLCVDPIPCLGCGVVMFCSVSCRSKSVSGDHWLECGIKPSLVTLSMTSSLPAVKMLREYSYHQLKNVYTELQNEKKLRPEDLAGLNDKGIYSSNSYRPIHYLCSHKEKLRFQELLNHCQVAFVLTKLVLQSKRFFVDENGLPFAPTEADLVLTGSIILSNLLRMEYNALKMNDPKQKSMHVGHGLFLALSLINHSCAPTAIQYQVGRTMVLRALRPIHAGEEITITYNLTFEDEELPSRKQTLGKYFISCDCIACQQHWPIFVVLPEITHRCVNCQLPMKNIDLTCHKCKVNYNSNSYRGNKKVLVAKLQDNNFRLLLELTKAREVLRMRQSCDPEAEKHMKAVWASIETVHKIVAMPCKVAGRMDRIMAQCIDAAVFYMY